MDNRTFSRQLEQRTKSFAIDIIRLSGILPRSPESRIIKNQVTKSGTSIGANYREANRSRSKADFANKIKISESETNETVYWLEIIQEMNWANEDKLKLLMEEANELLAIFTSIGMKLKPEIK